MGELKRGRWSTPELVRLRRLFPRTTIERVALALNRSLDTVRAQARRLFYREEPVIGPFSREEDDVLRRGFGVVAISDLSIVLGRPVDGVTNRASELRSLARTGRWDDVEVALLKELYPGRADDDLEVCLSRPVDEVRVMAAQLCLRKDKGGAHGQGAVRMPRWTDAEVDRLAELYPTCHNLEIARLIGRSVTSVANKAHQLGLKKAPELRRRLGAENAAGRHLR